MSADAKSLSLTLELFVVIPEFANHPPTLADKRFPLFSTPPREEGSDLAAIPSPVLPATPYIVSFTSKISGRYLYRAKGFSRG